MDKQHALLLLDTPVSGGTPPPDTDLPQNIQDKLFAWYGDFNDTATTDDYGRVTEITDKTGDPLNTLVLEGVSGLIFDDIIAQKSVVRSSDLYPFTKYVNSQLLDFLYNGQSFFISYMVGANSNVAGSHLLSNVDTVAQTNGLEMVVYGDGSATNGDLSVYGGPINMGLSFAVEAAMMAVVITFDAAGGTDNLKAYVNGVLEDSKTIEPFSNPNPADVSPYFFLQDWTLGYGNNGSMIYGELMIGDDPLTETEVGEIMTYYDANWGTRQLIPLPYRSFSQTLSNSIGASSKSITVPNNFNQYTGDVCVLFVSIYTPFTGTTYTDPPPTTPTVAGFTLIDSVPMASSSERVAIYAFMRVIQDGDFVTSIVINKSADINCSMVYVANADTSDPIVTGAGVAKYNSGAATTLTAVLNPTFEQDAVSIAFGAWKGIGANTTDSNYFAKISQTGTNAHTLYVCQNYRTDIGTMNINRSVAAQAKAMIIQVRAVPS